MTYQNVWTESDGILEMARERRRQVEEKNFTAQHDDHHSPEDLLAAGKCYIEYSHWDLTGSTGDTPPFDWPWKEEEWKPEESALENMVKGGALVAAAYDRLTREITEIRSTGDWG
jgi:hypothetical protein